MLTRLTPLRAGMLAASFLFLAQGASATTLTFDLQGGTQNDDLLGGYGDRVSGTDADASGSGAASAGFYGVGAEGATPNVVVDYDGPSPNLWTTGYSSLENVFYDDNDSGIDWGLTLTADAGFEVTLSSFDLGNFSGSTFVIPEISVIADGVTQFSSVNFSLPGRNLSPFSSFAPDVTGQVVQLLFTTTGLGGNTDNIGVDNLLFSQALQTTPAPVPLPAAGWMLLCALGSVRILRKRR